jgi:hypothetical protein
VSSWSMRETILEIVTLTDSDPEFHAWKAAYEGRTAGPVALGGRWYVPRERQRQRAPRGAKSAYKFLAEPVATPAPAATLDRSSESQNER